MLNHCQHNCLEELSSDHQKILEKLDELEKAVSETVINKDKVKEFLDFTEIFAEPHHEKEEKVLFPALERKGISNEGGPIGMMLFEHETKRRYVSGLQKALEADEKEKIKENAQNIISLLRDHISKEENILYPCAKDVLVKDELTILSQQCEELKSKI